MLIRIKLLARPIVTATSSLLQVTAAKSLAATTPSIVIRRYESNKDQKKSTDSDSYFPDLEKSRLLDSLNKHEIEEALLGSATPDYYEQVESKLHEEETHIAAHPTGSESIEHGDPDSLFSGLVESQFLDSLNIHETEDALLGSATADYYEQVESKLHEEETHIAAHTTSNESIKHADPDSLFPGLVERQFLDSLNIHETEDALLGSATADYYEQVESKLHEEETHIAAHPSSSESMEHANPDSLFPGLVERRFSNGVIKNETDKALLGSATDDYYEQVESHIEQDHLAEEIQNIQHHHFEEEKK